jgi:Ni/Fe-hydrogenase b-type cytochrome subunit
MKKHRLSTRLWHWVNLFALAILFMSGLNISNAHPHLYWGQWGFDPRDAWLNVVHFPGWATIPGFYSLAGARQWHVLFAWVFAVGLLLYMLVALVNGHFRRDIVTRRKEWRWSAIREDVAAHLRFDFSHGEGKYNFLQKLAYGVVLFVLLPLMIATGMAISPGSDAAFPWLLELFGGRQSARSIHFIVAWSLFGFLLLHVVLVLLSGPIGQLRDMITGGRIDEAS